MGTSTNKRTGAAGAKPAARRAAKPKPAAALARAERKVDQLARLEQLERVVLDGRRPHELALEHRCGELERHVVGRELDGDLDGRLVNLERLTLGREDA